LTRLSRLYDEWVWVPVSLRTPPSISHFLHIGSRSVFVDFPNHYYLSFIENAIRLFRQSLRKKVNVVDIIKKDAEMCNKDLVKEGIDWFKIVIRKNPPWCKSAYTVMYKVNYKKFCKFIDNFVMGSIWDGSLAKRYEYIYRSKSSLFSEIIAMADALLILNELKRNVKLKVLDDLTQVLKLLIYYDAKLDTVSYILLNEIGKILPLNTFFIGHRIAERAYFLVEELKALTNRLQTMIEAPPLIFRELRKILEALSFIYLQATMLYKDISVLNEFLSLYGEHVNVRDLIDTYDLIALNGLILWDSKKYFDEAHKAVYMKSLGDVIDKSVLKELSDGINMSKTKILKVIEDNICWLNLSLLGALRPKKLRIKGLEKYEVSDIMLLIPSFILAKGILKVNNTKKIKDTTEKISSILRELFEKYKYAYPAPSIAFMLQFVEKTTKPNVRLRELYSDYSFFVHPYPSSMQLSPYISILEYRILPHEIERFYEIALKILNVIIKELLSSIKMVNTLLLTDKPYKKAEHVSHKVLT